MPGGKISAKGRKKKGKKNEKLTVTAARDEPAWKTQVSKVGRKAFLASDDEGTMTEMQ